MVDLISNIHFKHIPDSFQRQLKNDMTKICSSSNIFVPADKTRNIYSMNASHYDKLLMENITKTYKKANSDDVKIVDLEAKKIASSLNLHDRMQKLKPCESYITLKDHKDNFLSKPACRLINPTKSEVGKVSKCLLEKVCQKVRSDLNFNQWSNSGSVLN